MMKQPKCMKRIGITDTDLFNEYAMRVHRRKLVGREHIELETYKNHLICVRNLWLEEKRKNKRKHLYDLRDKLDHEYSGKLMGKAMNAIYDQLLEHFSPKEIKAIEENEVHKLSAVLSISKLSEQFKGLEISIDSENVITIKSDKHGEYIFNICYIDTLFYKNTTIQTGITKTDYPAKVKTLLKTLKQSDVSLVDELFGLMEFYQECIKIKDLSERMKFLELNNLTNKLKSLAALYEFAYCDGEQVLTPNLVKHLVGK